MEYDNEMRGKTIGKSTWEPPKGKVEYTTLKISQKEITKMLNEREGGRKAGRGDSEFTQEFYEETYGLKKEEKD